MDHSENDKRFYVYVHKDQKGNIRYVGSGTDNRYRLHGGRSKEHKAIFDSLEKEIVIDGLSKMQSLEEEQKLLDACDSSMLFNKIKNIQKTRKIHYDLVSKYVYYDPTSSTFLRWKQDFISSYFNRKKDSEAGWLHKQSGYLGIAIDGIKYRTHRIIWVLCNKQDLPSNLIIDHIDRNPSNNLIENLRTASYHENVLNSQRPVSKTTNFGGVVPKSDGMGFLVRWKENRVTKSAVFNTSRFGYDEEGNSIAFKIACEYRILKVEQVYNKTEDNTILERIAEIDAIRKGRSIGKSNRTGVNGVSWEEGLLRWVAWWSEEKKSLSKKFKPSKLFPDLPFEEAKQKAFELAVEYRKQKELELY